MESWLNSSVKDRESALISRRHGVHRRFLQWFTEIDVLLDLRWVSQGICIFLKDVKPLGVYDVEHEIAI